MHWTHRIGEENIRTKQSPSLAAFKNWAIVQPTYRVGNDLQQTRGNEMGSIRSWFKRLLSYDHRQGERLEAPLLVAYYWDGSIPTAHKIRDISSTGFYLLTTERWHPGTVVTMTLQRSDTAIVNPSDDHYISVHSKVVRLGDDGVGFAFVPLETRSSNSAQTSKRARPSKSTVADKKALRKFLDHLKLDDGCVVIGLDRRVEKEKSLGQDVRLRTPGDDGMKRLRDESGQSLVVAALAMTCLCGFVALAADVGTMFHERRLAQIAADSGAIAAASQLSGDWNTAARTDATQNGFTDGTNGATVAVHNGPSSGPHAGNSAYVEVIVSQSQPTFFMQLFGRTAMTVSARAVATNGPSTGCIFTLDPNPTTTSKKKIVSAPGVSVTGGASLTLPTCGIEDDATDSPAFLVSGGGAVSATIIGSVGTASVLNGDIVTPTPVSGMTAVSDPLNSLTPPPASDYSTGCLADPKITKSTTIGPASPSGFVCYNGLTTPKGSPTITLNPGLYIFNGPNALDISSGTTFNGTGVTFYFVNGASFTFSNGATLNLSAPTGVPYNGILFYQDPTDNAADSFVGGSTGNLNGIFYLPSANLSFENGNSSTFTTDLVVGSLTMTGAATLKPFIALNGTSPISSPRLVE